MDFILATYNVLATAYIRPEYYPKTAPPSLADANRLPALVRRLQGLGADVYCLQEVERDCFRAIDVALSTLGFEGFFAMKAGNRPDGCATFCRTSRCRVVQHARMEYEERFERGPSGHIAQLLVLEVGRRQLGVANTHLKWDPPNTPSDSQYGYQQIHELMEWLRSDEYRSLPWIICGDLNVESSSPVVEAIHDDGFRSSQGATEPAPTCVTNGRAKTIDYIFTAPELLADPLPQPRVDDTTPLPSATEPSDHIPVVARVGWR